MLKKPIFVAEGMDVRYYTSVFSAERSLEAVDVAADIYKVFDASGRRLSLRIRSDDTVEIDRDVAEASPQETEQLRTSLIGCLSHGKQHSQLLLQQMTLDQLVNLLQQTRPSSA